MLHLPKVSAETAETSSSSTYLLLALPCEASREKKTVLLYACTTEQSFLIETNSNITSERFQTLG